MTPEERAKALDDNEEVEEAHESAAADGESKVPNVSYIFKNSKLINFHSRISKT
jgi:hypothetical protein